MTADNLQALTNWVEQQIQSLDTNTGPLTLSPLSGDAGFRRYYRIHNGGKPMLAVHAPVETEDTPLFVALAKTMQQGAVSTPNIIAVDEQRGFLIIEDFGDDLLANELEQEPDNADAHYGQAIITLLALQQLRPYSLDLPSYSPTLLQNELNLFPHWFIGELLQQSHALENFSLTPAFNFLIDNSLQQPQVLVHRDYHSRNLIERQGRSLGVIDFQGAVWGPITYDIVSLLKDCYLRWPADKVEQWALSYARLAKDVGLLPDISDQRFLHWFHLTGLQRHLKVLGIFARLALRDGKQQYLADLPRVLAYVRDTAGRFEQTQPLLAFIDEQLMPAIESQAWYQPGEQPL